MDFFKILAIVGLISSWMTKSLEDGKITLAEALELISKLAGPLGLPLEFNIAEVIGGPEKEAAKLRGEGVTLDFPETSKIEEREDKPINEGETARPPNIPIKLQ